MPLQTKYTEGRDSGQIAFNPLPAVAIGGPPHSGKSVLAYSLTQALRAMDVDHYLLRAYPPDGEGDWFLAGDQPFVRHFRVKGSRSEAWLAPLIRDIAQRHVPLLVDMGGLPTAEQEAILDACTHAILLTRDAASHTAWQDRTGRHGLVLLADLASDLHGDNVLTAENPVLRGCLAGLNRGVCAAGPAFHALVDHLAARFTQAAEGVRRRHLETAPVELAVDLRRLATHLSVDPRAWPPEILPAVLDYLPQERPLGLYGRGPNWLYAAVAAHARPAPFYLFDVRHGWIKAPALRRANATGPAWTLRRQPQDQGMLWTFCLPDTYLDLAQAGDLTLPPCPNTSLIVSGKLPLWLWAALAQACDVPWLAVVQPHLEGAVVVHSQGGDPAPGAVLPVTASAHTP